MIKPNKDYSLAAKTKSITKNSATVLLVVLFLIVISTVGFVWAQNINTTKKTIVRNIDSKHMKNLTVKNDLQKWGVEVIDSNDKAFSAALMQYIGGKEAIMTLAESAKPLAIIIRNNSSKEIVGISLRWQFVKSNTETKSFPQIEANPGVLMGLRPKDSQMLGKTSLINDKSIRFFSYFNTFIDREIVNTNLRVKNPNIRYKNDLNLEEIQQSISFAESQKKIILNDVIDVSVAVDGVFFADGTFVGEDQNFFFDSMNGRLQARKDFANQLKEAKLIGKSNSEILGEFLLTPSDTLSFQNKEPQLKYTNAKEAFELNYKASLNSLKKEISMKRSNLGDNFVVKELESLRDDDFTLLRKLK